MTDKDAGIKLNLPKEEEAAKIILGLMIIASVIGCLIIGGSFCIAGTIDYLTGCSNIQPVEIARIAMVTIIFCLLLPWPFYVEWLCKKLKRSK